MGRLLHTEEQSWLLSIKVGPEIEIDPDSDTRVSKALNKSIFVPSVES